MKKLSFYLVLLLICSAGCKTTKPVADKTAVVIIPPAPVPGIQPTETNFSDPSSWLLGYFKPERFIQVPYSSWYISGFDNYQINSDAVNKLFDISKDNLKIKVVMGTWCPDSRREVPKFMRLLDIWKFPLSQVVFIGVDNAKLSAVEEYSSLNIQRVPTFIIYKNNIEAGRIIENPVTSLEQDMVNILTRNE
jgi:thiol-disulfide isomerase/thioredoxin